MSCTSDTIAFKRIINFRDLGGHTVAHGGRVRTGTVFRSATLSFASAEDLLTLRFLGIRSVLDLRTSAELELHPAADVDRIGALLHHVPILSAVWDSSPFDLGIDAVQFLAARYDELLEHNGDAMAKAVLTTVDTNGPVLLHCTAGKDRTGILAAVMLACVGVSDAVIADDYARSAAAMPELLQMFEDQSAGFAAMFASQPSAFLAAPREGMLRTLTALRWNHGGASAYLLENGLPDSSLRRLRCRLLGSP